MSKLCSLFYGNKKYLQEHHQQYLSERSLSNQVIQQLFVPYTSFLKKIRSKNDQISLLQIFQEFIKTCINKFHNWQFQKLSAWVQISAHVFEHSFQKHLNQKQSFQYFSQVVVRHSLFRPPHSVNVFNYEEAKQMMEFWLSNFVRFYTEYQLCFQATLNQTIYSVSAGFIPVQAKGERKQIKKQDFLAKFSNVLQISQPSVESH